jgi:hypothetical protein
VSTAHLTSKTRQQLETFDLEGVLYYPKGPWGWFVNVPAREDGLVVGDEVPADLKFCIEFAQSQEKDWIMFDCDGSIVPDLPTFEDDELLTGANHAALHTLAAVYAQHLTQKFGRNVKAVVTINGKISVKDDHEGGMYGLVSAEFVQAMVMHG